jgi:hypothetical protein
MTEEKNFLNIHPDVYKLGFVSFLTDISSEAIFSVFSVFFTVKDGIANDPLGKVLTATNVIKSDSRGGSFSQFMLQGKMSF